MLIAGGLSAGTGIIGNEQARNASNKAMREARGMRDEAKGYLSEIDPSYLENLDAESYQALMNVIAPGTVYAPSMYDYIAQPEAYQYGYLGDAESTLAADSPEMRAMQIKALGELQDRAESGLDAKSRAEMARAKLNAGEMARGREEAIIQNMQARGMAGSGVEAAMRQIASQQAANRLGQAGLDEASVNAQQRALATLQAMQGAGNVRGQDVALNQSNADILNRFALENSARAQQIANANTALRNRTMENNIAEQRRISGANTGLSNQAQLQNQLYDQMARQSFNQNLMQQVGARNQKTGSIYDARANKANAMSGAALGYVNDAYAKGAANADYSRGIWGALGSIPQAWGQYEMYNSIYGKPQQQNQDVATGSNVPYQTDWNRMS
jgi:hypothetical protein